MSTIKCNACGNEWIAKGKDDQDNYQCAKCGDYREGRAMNARRFSEEEAKKDLLAIINDPNTIEIFMFTNNGKYFFPAWWTKNEQGWHVGLYVKARTAMHFSKYHRVYIRDL